ncbi:MAG TPA: tetratricopeptide repeat protein [Stellaceae bacterium]
MVALILGASIGVGHAQEKQTARPEIGQPVEQAAQLLKQKKYKEALAKLTAADLAPDKTAYERYVIEGTRAAVDQASGDYPGAIKALEAALATGILAPPDALLRIEALVQLNYQVKDYAQVVAEANRYYQQGGTADGPRLLQVQAYYLNNDFANAARAIRMILDADQKAGKKPAENLLLTLLNSEYRQANEAGRIDALERLAALYPKKQYWSDLLTAIAKKPGFASRLTLDLDRLKAATGAMGATSDYMDAAQLALLAGLPGEAKSLLDKGYAAGILGTDAQADREKRLADMAAQQAADAAKALGQKESEADAASNGAALEKVAEGYASFGQYDKAVAVYSRALQKGGMQNPDDAKLHLGIAYLAAGQRAKARETLGGVAGNDGTRDLAQVWLILAKA